MVGRLYRENNQKITNVIVYPEWAYVTRIAKVTIEKGETKLIYKNLPAWIDPESIQIKVNGSDQFKILGNKYYIKDE